MKDLAGLKADLAAERGRVHARQCQVCRRGKDVTDAIERYVKARDKSPAEWTGMTVVMLLRWAGAEKAGVGIHAIKRHYRATKPGFWEGLVDG